MDACESLGAGACRERDLWNHVHSHQRPAAQNPAVEPSSGGFAWRCVDGLVRHHHARARLSRGQLRHDRALARDDAHLGLSLSRTFFRLGGACCLEILPHAGATTALPHAYVGNSLGPTGQRHDLFDADAARNRGYPAWKTSDAALPHGASDEREYRQCCYPRRQSTKHDHRPFFTHWICAIFGGASTAGDYRTRDQLHNLASGVSKDFEEAVVEGEALAIPTLDCSLFAIVCVVFVLIFACFVAGLNLAWTALAGAVLVMVLARRDTHEVLKLVDWHLLVFFAALFVVVDGLSDTGLPDAIYSRLRPVFGSHVPTQAWNLTWFAVAGSNIFSNVPFVLVAGKWINRFAEPELMWKVLALATTFAGNLTIVGSVANMIVVESAREHLEVSFWDYARFGIPITILTTVAGVAVLLLLR